MKTTGPRWINFAVLAAFSFPLSAFSQEAVSSPPDFATGLIQSLAAQHPWLTTLVAVIGFLRIIFKPLIAAAHSFVAATDTEEDDRSLEVIERSTAFKVFAFKSFTFKFFAFKSFTTKINTTIKRHLLDYTASIKLTRGTGAAATRLLSLTLALCLLPLAFAPTGCATWDGLSANQQAVAKAAAKVALSFGIQQLGDSVKEVRPYQDALMGLLNATFSASDDGKTIGTALAEGVERVVKDPALRQQVLDALKQQLAGATAASAQTPDPIRQTQSQFNAAIASKL